MDANSILTRLSKKDYEEINQDNDINKKNLFFQGVCKL